LALTSQAIGAVSILFGNGAGGFPGSISVALGAGTNPQFVAVADFNGDGNLDLVIANQGSNNVSILLGNGVGKFSGPANFAVETDPSSLAIADFNGDGNLDLAVANRGGSVSILLGNGTGSFSAPTGVGAGHDNWSVVAGDF